MNASGINIDYQNTIDSNKDDDNLLLEESSNADNMPAEESSNIEDISAINDEYETRVNELDQMEFNSIVEH